MNALMQLKEIVENQKSIRISRLAPIVEEFELMYINQGKRLSNQKKELKFLQMESNRRNQFQEKRENRVR